jgi:hypothetical protein
MTFIQSVRFGTAVEQVDASNTILFPDGLVIALYRTRTHRSGK